MCHFLVMTAGPQRTRRDPGDKAGTAGQGANQRQGGNQRTKREPKDKVGRLDALVTICTKFVRTLICTTCLQCSSHISGYIRNLTHRLSQTRDPTFRTLGGADVPHVLNLAWATDRHASTVAATKVRQPCLPHRSRKPRRRFICAALEPVCRTGLRRAVRLFARTHF